ncbi:MAG TPA: prefoldin subunit alpha [Candidatus Nanoarchaeia archaeon]|nr:prefoldin subunit alpha [Candidatus Nanoarchaeia archaeon]
MAAKNMENRESESANQELLREKFMHFQQLQQHIEQINEHIETLNLQNVDIDTSKTAILEFSTSAKNQEMLAPIANGIFVKAKVTESKKLLINVGADTVVEKTAEQIVQLLAEKQLETTKQIGEAQELLQEFNEQAMKIYKEVEEL